MKASTGESIASLAVTLLILSALALITLTQSGCAYEVYAGGRRIDKVEQTQVMVNQPWYCAYIECKGDTHAK
jgi:hypothetical protein